MKTFLKTLIFGAALAASTTLAYANPIPSGSTLRICCNGTVAVVGSGPTTGLFFSNPEPSINGSGGLQVFTGPNSIILSNTFLFAGVHPGVGELLFTSTIPGSTLQFFVTSYTYAGNVLTFTGYLSVNGAVSTNATLKEILGNSAPGGGNYYEGDLVTTPEPSSLVLLGTGLAGAAGLMIRRRKIVQA